VFVRLGKCAAKDGGKVLRGTGRIPAVNDRRDARTFRWRGSKQSCCGELFCLQFQQGGPKSLTKCAHCGVNGGVSKREGGGKARDVWDQHGKWEMHTSRPHFFIPRQLQNRGGREAAIIFFLLVGKDGKLAIRKGKKGGRAALWGKGAWFPTGL